MSEPWIAASSAEEFVELLRTEQRNGGAAAKGLSSVQNFERLQMRCFLLGIVGSWEFGFPVAVNHTSHRNPDFVIVAPPRRTIGVECSRITNEKIGRLRKLAATGKIRSGYSVSSAMKPGKKKTPSLLNEATLNVQMVFPTTAADQRRFYLQRSDEVIAEKTAAMDKEDYQPCNQYWLLLTDDMSFDRAEIEERCGLIHGRVKEFWRKRHKWFSRIVIQDRSLGWHVQITKDGITSRTTG